MPTHAVALLKMALPSMTNAIVSGATDKKK